MLLLAVVLEALGVDDGVLVLGLVMSVELAVVEDEVLGVVGVDEYVVLLEVVADGLVLWAVVDGWV